MNQCIVSSPDTDVFLVLPFHYPSLPNALIFHSGNGSNLHNFSIRTCYEALSNCRVNALRGFHTFRGFNQTGRFMGKSKTFWLENFMNADDNRLKALRDLGKNYLLKSYVCYLLLNLTNICIYCAVLQSVTVNRWKKSIYLFLLFKVTLTHFIVVRESGVVNFKFSKDQPKEGV